jgi:hypothetical protein
MSILSMFYREASVMHEHGCRSRAWKVHATARFFYLDMDD